MRKHVTMTLLDTEQSYVESLRTLMQVRLGVAWVPECSHFESRWLLDMWEHRGPRLERNDRGAYHPSIEEAPPRAGEECREAIRMPNWGTQGRCFLLLLTFHLSWQCWV